MPVLTAPEARQLTSDCFAAAGFSRPEAELVARLMVEANLTGHETHGVRQIPRYLERIRNGEIKPGAPVTIVQETPTTAILDGHRTMGYIGATRAVEVAIAKAQAMKIAAVGVRNLDHVGRVGAYPELAAAQGLVCLAFVNAQGRGRSVAPFGGLGRLLGTNPISAALPSPSGAPILLDFATSAVAANKLRVAQTRGRQTGEGWIVDENGRPTRDPAVYNEGRGHMLPLGGEQGHKGFGLAVLVDLMGGVLAGAGCAYSNWEQLNNGTFLIVIDPLAFVSRELYDQQVSALTDYLHAAPTAPGAPPVMLPGEYEARNRQRHLAQGFEIEESVWKSIQEAAAQIGVRTPVPMAAPALAR